MGSACPRAARHSPNRQHGHSCTGVHPGWVVARIAMSSTKHATALKHLTLIRLLLVCSGKGLAVLLEVHVSAGPSKLYTASSTALAGRRNTPARTLTCSQAGQWCGDHAGQLLRGVHGSAAISLTRTAVNLTRLLNGANSQG